MVSFSASIFYFLLIKLSDDVNCFLLKNTFLVKGIRSGYFSVTQEKFMPTSKKLPVTVISGKFLIMICGK